VTTVLSCTIVLYCTVTTVLSCTIVLYCTVTTVLSCTIVLYCTMTTVLSVQLYCTVQWPLSCPVQFETVLLVNSTALEQCDKIRYRDYGQKFLRRLFLPKPDIIAHGLCLNEQGRSLAPNWEALQAFCTCSASCYSVLYSGCVHSVGDVNFSVLCAMCCAWPVQCVALQLVLVYCIARIGWRCTFWCAVQWVYGAALQLWMCCAMYTG